MARWCPCGRNRVWNDKAAGATRIVEPTASKEPGNRWLERRSARMRRRTIVEATTVSSTPAPRVRAGSFASLRLAMDGQAISVDRHGSLVIHDLRLRPAKVGAAVVLERSQLASGCGFAAGRSPLLALAICMSGAPSRFARDLARWRLPCSRVRAFARFGDTSTRGSRRSGDRPKDGRNAGICGTACLRGRLPSRSSTRP